MNPKGCTKPPNRVIETHKKRGQPAQSATQHFFTEQKREDIEELESSRDKTEENATTEYPDPKTLLPDGKQEKESPQASPYQSGIKKPEAPLGSERHSQVLRDAFFPRYQTRKELTRVPTHPAVKQTLIRRIKVFGMELVLPRRFRKLFEILLITRSEDLINYPKPPKQMK